MYSNIGYSLWKRFHKLLSIMSRATIRDVAHKANVGIGTVSRVLNNHPAVREETRQRVFQAMQELNFKPNYAARHLPRKTGLKHLGVITQPFLSYHSFAERLRGVHQALSESKIDYELILYSVNSLQNLDERITAIAEGSLVEGLLIVDFHITPEQRDRLNLSGIPFLGLANFKDGDWVCIGANDVEGGHLATTYLLEQGHRRIAYVGDEFFDSFNFHTSEERFKGYERAMQDWGLTVNDDYVRLGPNGYDTAKALMNELLTVTPLPTAVFAMSDIQALACIAAIRETGLDVPGDISVIGYDDLDMSVHSGLTTVRQHLEQIGKLGIEILIQGILEETLSEPPALPLLAVIERQTVRRL
jgi:DNA-binding LacI/PurR family transcriptional regulator